MELLQGLFETFFIIKNMINKNIIVCSIDTKETGQAIPKDVLENYF